jgi:hypothetical protein
MNIYEFITKESGRERGFIYTRVAASTPKRAAKIFADAYPGLVRVTDMSPLIVEVDIDKALAGDYQCINSEEI